MTPSEALASAVLRQAVQDLLIKSAAHGSGATDANPTAGGKVEALKFLTDASGAFADARAFWCHIAGKDPDRLRQTTLALLEGDDRLLDAYPGSKFDRAAALAESRQLYLARKRETESAKTAWLEAAERRKASLKVNLERQNQLDAINRERAERREEMRQWQEGRKSALEAEISRVVDALKDGPRTITQVCHAVALTYLPARSRLEEAARRGLVQCIGKGVWQLAPASNQSPPCSLIAASG